MNYKKSKESEMTNLDIFDTRYNYYWQTKKLQNRKNIFLL